MVSRQKCLYQDNPFITDPLSEYDLVVFVLYGFKSLSSVSEVQDGRALTQNAASL